MQQRYKAFLMVELPVLIFGGAAGVWLFYVQHQFEGTYWARHVNWDPMKAALEAWGAGSNLFHQGVAKESGDPEFRTAEAIFAAARRGEPAAQRFLDGVAVLAEGLIDSLAEEDLKRFGNIEYDDHGHIRQAIPQRLQISPVRRRRVERERKLGQHARQTARVDKRCQPGAKCGEVRILSLIRQAAVGLDREEERLGSAIEPALHRRMGHGGEDRRRVALVARDRLVRLGHRALP